MRADMGGAACVTGCLYSAAKLKLPINLKVLIPLCENMPSSRVSTYLRRNSAVCLHVLHQIFAYLYRRIAKTSRTYIKMQFPRVIFKLVL